MAKQCCVCGINTIFYIWSSSRNFPRELLSDKLNMIGKSKELIIEGVDSRTVCMKCYNEMINNE